MPRNARPALAAAVLIAGTLAASAAAGAAAAPRCAPPSAGDPADSVRRMYAAAMKLDREGIQREFAPDFYAFDGGKRFSGPELIELIRRAQESGKTYAWSVTEPEIHVSCDLAWATWTNRGAITDASGTTPLTWLESAVLVWRDGAWKLSFFHSTRIPPAPR